MPGPRASCLPLGVFVKRTGGRAHNQANSGEGRPNKVNVQFVQGGGGRVYTATLILVSRRSSSDLEVFFRDVSHDTPKAKAFYVNFYVIFSFLPPSPIPSILPPLPVPS